MKTIKVVAAIIVHEGRIFATQRGYGEWAGWWEFPGGKIEPGESPEEALVREIREELATELAVDKYVCTVEHDYPTFHLTMHNYLCHVVSGELQLLEHEAAKWLDAQHIMDVDWLPADLKILPALSEILKAESETDYYPGSMIDKLFYIEEEEIIFESYVEEPDLETPVERHTGSGAHMCEELVIEDGPKDNITFSVSGPGTSKKRNRHVLFSKTSDRSAEEALGSCACVEPAPTPSRTVLVDIDELRQKGVPEYIISLILDSKKELSALRITRSGRIVLTDYKIEIKMPPLDKALYFLYLRHPEGIRFKELCDHRDELMDLYSSITGREDIELIRASVDSLIDPLSNSVNEKCSRIKRAFTKAFSPELAKHYYIDGKSGEPKSIALDRQLVTWETLRS